MSDPRPVLGSAEQLTRATHHLVRTVDALSEEDLREPSLLPGWSRAHVVAHLALNAEGLAGVLDGLLADEPASMYASDDARDADIAELASAEPADLRDRLLASTTLFEEALVRVPETAWAGQFERTPGGVRFPVARVPHMRRREVEIHHADLDAGFGPEDWSAEFLAPLLDDLVADRSQDAAFTLDLPTGRVAVGDGGPPVVAGSPALLAWWLLGRGHGEGLASEDGLPTLGPWR